MSGDESSLTNSTDIEQTGQNISKNTTTAEILPTANAGIPSERRHLKKLNKLSIIILALILLLSGSAAAYFGYMAPNRPERIWGKALSNTAAGYDRLVNHIDQHKDIKGLKTNGTITLTGKIAGDGKFESESFEQKSSLKGDLGIAGTRYTFEVLSTVPEGAKTADVYLKAGGTKGLGALLGGSSYANAGPVIDSLDNQWIAIDHTLFDQLLSAETAVKNPDLTPDDMMAIAKAIGEVNRDYLFSTNSNKRVLTIARYMGKEERDNRTVHHYEVGFDKENLKEYITALKEKLKGTKLKEVLEVGGKNYDQEFDTSSIFQDIDRLKGDERADVWVDANTRLIRFVRFPEKDKRDNYLELQIPYNGGDEFPFGAVLKDAGDNPVNLAITLTVNSKTNAGKLTLNGHFGQGNSEQTIEASMNVGPNSQPVEVTKPEGARSITEILSAFYGSVPQGGPVITSPFDPPVSNSNYNCSN